MFNLLTSIKHHLSKDSTAVKTRLHKQFTGYCRKTKTLVFSQRVLRKRLLEGGVVLGRALLV